MKSHKILILVVAALMPFKSNAQTEEKAPFSVDSVSIQLKLQQLEQQKVKLVKQIEAEDRKRNQSIAGVSVENMEVINIRQDSICLSLRSELTDLDLAIAEQKEALQSLSTTTAIVLPAVTASPSTQQSNHPTTVPPRPNRVQQAINAINHQSSSSK